MLPGLVARRRCFRAAGWAAASLLSMVSCAENDGQPSPLDPRPDRSAPAETQPLEFQADSWQVEHGLPDNTVNALLQRRDGFLWVATAQGLARFDGLEFVRLPAPAGSPVDPVPITCLLEDRAGSLWIGTQGSGLWCLDQGRLRTYGLAEGLPDLTITSLVAGAEDRVWIGTLAGLCYRQGDQFQSAWEDPGQPAVPVAGLHVGRAGDLWVTTRTGVSRLNQQRLEPFDFGDDAQGRSSEFIGVFEDRRGELWAYGDTFLVNVSQGRRFNYFKASDPSSSRVWTISEDHAGRLWIGTRGRGLFTFDGRRFDSVPLPEGAPWSDVRAILEDRERNVWVGSGGAGLVRLRPRRVQLLGAAEGLPRAPTCGLQDREGVTWIGFDGAGLWRSAGGRLRPFQTDDAFAFLRRVWALADGRDGTLWVGTWGHGLGRLRDGELHLLGLQDGLADTIVRSLAPDPAGSIWIGLQSGHVQRLAAQGFQTFGVREGLSGKPVTVLLATRRGELWVGSQGGGLRRWTGQTYAPVAEEPSWVEAEVCALTEDSRGRIWAGTANGILACWEGGHRHADLVLVESAKAPITAILEDDERRLWMGSGRGLAVFLQGNEPSVEPTANSWERRWYGHEHDLTHVFKGAGFPAGFRTREGPLAFCTTDGLLMVEPRRFANRSVPASAHIEALLLDGKPLAGESSPLRPTDSPHVARFPARWSSLEFRFTAPSLGSPQRVRFKHRLDGLDLDWVDGGAVRQVRYGRLPPGDYRFRVRAGYDAELWSQPEATLAFVVPTPWWRSWWCLSLSSTFGFAVVIVTVRRISLRRLRHRMARLRQEHAFEKERTRIAQDMHDEIGAKLTRISFLSELARQHDPQTEAVNAHLHAIAETSRQLLHSLDEIVWAVNPRNDNLEQLAAYLGQYANEYLQSTGIEYRLEVPPPLPACPLSVESRHNLFLAFEEALGNALKHAHATLISVRMQLKLPTFEITVTDNGRGFAEPALPAPDPAPASDPAQPRRASYGLENLRKRMAEIGGTCRIVSHPNQGTTVTLAIPVPLKPTRMPSRDARAEPPEPAPPTGA